MALENNVSILCGAPGTGKTTVAKKIIDELRKQKLSIALAAPTGKAAKRMTEATGNDAVTIHRLLEPYMQDDDFQFQRDEERPLELEIIILHIGFQQPVNGDSVISGRFGHAFCGFSRGRSECDR